MSDRVPVIIFAHTRSEHLRRTLAGLRRDCVPLLYAFSDGPRTAEQVPKVESARKVLRQIDWCQLKLVERDDNWGLGKSILAGVTEVLKLHESAIVFEDDLLSRPGTYQYMAAALRHYREEKKVMSITAWTHPLVIPPDIGGQPYFDGRAECWGWGTWARAWQGMDQPAEDIIATCIERGIDIYKYGADLPVQARYELQNNIWAVRWLFRHILDGGLCLRPPRTLVENIGFDVTASNTKSTSWVQQFPSDECVIPVQWPVPIEAPACQALWQREYGGKPTIVGWLRKAGRRLLRRIGRA